VAWYENNGGPTPAFTERVISVTADSAQSVHAADVDGDGDMDVLSASAFDDKIAWYENDGGSPPSFTERVISSAADGAHSVFTADVDGDGDTDVLSASRYDDKVAWYENDGGLPPSFTEHIVSTTADYAISVFATDVDGDGDMDILSASPWDHKIAWYQNGGGSTPSFSERIVSTASAHPASVFAADMDADGDADLLSASVSDDTIAWYENDGGSPPSFTRHIISVAADYAECVFAADVDGDGDTDVLSASLYDDKIAWYENDGGLPPSFTERVISTNADGATSVFAGDVDGDGDIDVLSASQDAKIAWYENKTIQGSAAFPAQSVISTSADGAVSVFGADVDGDGDMDVVSASFFDDKIAWYENDGAASLSFTERVISTSADGACSVFAADVDADGDLDVLSASPNDNKIAWYESDGASPLSFTERVISSSADRACSVFACDVDGDGDMDVLSASSGDEKIAWYESDGASPPSFTQHVISTGAAAGCVSAADVDGDGDVDVVCCSSPNPTIAWYENDGASPASFTERAVFTCPRGPQCIFPADADGDGDTDVLAASFGDDKIAWYENNGGSPPSFTERVISTSADDALSVFAGDLDGDGDTDVLWASFGDDKIAWYENDGTSPPSFTERVISIAADGAQAVFTADVDSDGDMDVLSASEWDDKIAWYENKGGQFALPTTDAAPARLYEDETDDMLKVVATHRGRSGDTDMELVTLELLFEETPADPLSSAEANALIENLFIYLDDGSGSFEAGSDTLVSTVATLGLTAGIETVTFADADPNVQVSQGTPETYFAVVETTADGGSQTPNSFMVTHLTETTSTAEDRDNDIPLKLEYADDVSSTIVVIPSGMPHSFIAKNQAGQTVLRITDDGDVLLKGVLTASLGSISATSGSEVLVKDSGGAVVARIETSSGDLDLAGSITTRQGSITPTSAGEFIVKDGGGSVVAYISASGDMVIKGEVHEGFVFP